MITRLLYIAMCYALVFGHVESLATQLLVQQLVQANHKQNIKAVHMPLGISYYWLLETVLFFTLQELIQTNNKQNMKLLNYWPFVQGIHQVDSPHKGPVMQKIFPC